MLPEESPWWDKKVPGVCSKRSAERSQRENTDRIRGQQWERGTQFHQHKELIAVSSEAWKWCCKVGSKQHSKGTRK